MSGKTGPKEGDAQLANLSQVRRFCARLINDREHNRIASGKYRDLIFGIKVLRDIIAAADIEQRIEALETKLNGGQ